MVISPPYCSSEQEGLVLGEYMMLKERVNQYIRVLKIMKKPSMEEFKLAAKVTLIGTVVIGVIGYTIYVVFNLLNI